MCNMERKYVVESWHITFGIFFCLVCDCLLLFLISHPEVTSNFIADLAIGSFLSGHALVVKSRPVAVLSGTVTSNQSSVTWEGEAPLTLTTCLNYTGHMLPQSLSKF